MLATVNCHQGESTGLIPRLLPKDPPGEASLFSPLVAGTDKTAIVANGIQSLEGSESFECRINMIKASLVYTLLTTRTTRYNFCDGC